MASSVQILCAAIVSGVLVLAYGQPSAAGATSSYFLLDDTGSYKYAYDAGNGIEGTQRADAQNEVTGHYTYYDDKGVHYTVKYKAGVRGYEPEILTPSPQPQQQLQQHTSENTLHASSPKGDSLQFVRNAIATMQQSRQPIQLSFNSQHGIRQPLALNGIETTSEGAAEQPYEFSYLADQSARIESADGDGNVVGKYSYYDEAGFHDLAYKAGNGIGFVIVGGSLSDTQTGGHVNHVQSFAEAADPTKPQLVVNVSQEPFGSYSYKVLAPSKKSIHQESRRVRRKF